SGVVTVRSRSPVATAMAAATVQDLSGGRFILGIGVGSGVGREESRPTELVARYVELVRRLLERGPVDADEGFGTPAFRLDLPAAGSPPAIWLAALGDRMVGMAGAVADGVLLNWCTPERVAAARGILIRGAEQAGRDPAGLTGCCATGGRGGPRAHPAGGRGWERRPRRLGSAEGPLPATGCVRSPGG